MKVCLNTFYRETHVGAFMQAYALSKVLKNHGHEVEFVQYERQSQDFSPSFKLRLISMVCRKQATIQGYALARARHFRESPNQYRNLLELDRNPPKGDIYLCGSDQIWNPSLMLDGKFDPVYFLQYGPKGIPRMSYAASFGGHNPSNEECEMLRKYCSCFDAISVREPKGKEILENIIRRKVRIVLDPTLLLEDYSELINQPPVFKKYILLYSLQDTPQLRNTAMAVSDYYNAPILSAGGPLLPWKVIGKRVTIHSPSQWISLINNAEAVVTNSFHGIVFSLQLKKNITVVPLSAKKEIRNERIFHLCNTLGVRNAIIPEDLNAVNKQKVRWDQLSQKLDAWRQESIEYLRTSLKTCYDKGS